MITLNILLGVRNCKRPEQHLLYYWVYPNTKADMRTAFADPNDATTSGFWKVLVIYLPETVKKYSLVIHNKNYITAIEFPSIVFI